MPARRKAIRKGGPRSPAGGADLVVRVAEQMAAVVERGLARMLRKLPARARTEAAASKIGEAIRAMRRQADAVREQAHDLETRGAEAAAAVWRPLADRLERAVAELERRLVGRG